MRESRPIPIVEELTHSACLIHTQNNLHLPE